MGVEREIDSLGRLVLPIEYRRKLGITFNSKVLVSLKDDTILISSTQLRCLLCNKEIDANHRFKLCDNCISTIKANG